MRWRRAQGRECYACPSLIKCDATILEEMGPTKDDLETALENDRDKHAKFMGKLSDWEEKRAQGSNSRGKASVESFNSDSIECRKIGYLWSVPLYIQIKKRHPTEDKLTVQTINGQKGVVLDESHGTPSGVVEIFAKREAGVKRAGVLLSTDDGANLSELRQAHTNARKNGTTNWQIRRSTWRSEAQCAKSE